MNHVNLIEQFYTAFSNGNVEEMLACYHKDIVFADPAFGTLKGDRACNMWKMLLSVKDNDLTIKYDGIEADEKRGTVNWVAEYHFGTKKRKVINKVTATFLFKDGQIIQHTDTFDVWKWTRQALGIPGYLMGWTPYMKQKIQKMTNKKLDRFIDKQ